VSDTAVILIVEDREDDVFLMRKSFEKAGLPNPIKIVRDGEEALEQASCHKPAVLLLDLSMPKLNGWEVAKRIRQMPELSGTAIIAFTAHALVGDELKAKAAGCDDYISKPCLPKDVVAKVVFWLERPTNAAA